MIRTMTTPGSGLSLLGAVLLFLLPFLPRIQANEAAPCYAPNTKRIDARYMPCISMDGMDSMCCRLNATDPDICKPNGLCYWEDIDGGGSDKPGRAGWYRGLCTRQDWDTPNCLPKTMCDDDAGGDSSYTSRLFTCNDGKYCCGNTSDCCTDQKMFTVSPTLIPIGSSASSGAATITATVSGKSDSSTKTAIGLGVGIPLGILMIAGAGGGFLWGRRSMKAKYAQIQNQGFNIPMGVVQAGGEVQHADSKSVHEADIIQPQPLELPAGRNDR